MDAEALRYAKRKAISPRGASVGSVAVVGTRRVFALFVVQPFFWEILAQVSRNDTVRLNTSAPGLVSESTQK